MTKIINLFGGPGIGKSTTSCGLYYKMKLKHLNVELVREYVKSWAWEGKTVGQFDQYYITGKQIHYESLLYNKVDYIVTDSPILMGPMYELFYTDQSPIESAVKQFLNAAKENGHEHLNFLLSRTKPYEQKGRYENETMAIKFDGFMGYTLEAYKVPYYKIDVPEDKVVDEILSKLNLN